MAAEIPPRGSSLLLTCLRSHHVVEIKKILLFLLMTARAVMMMMLTMMQMQLIFGREEGSGLGCRAAPLICTATHQDKIDKYIKRIS